MRCGYIVVCYMLVFLVLFDCIVGILLFWCFTGCGGLLLAGCCLQCLRILIVLLLCYLSV